MRLQQFLETKQQLLTAAKSNPKVRLTYLVTKYIKVSFKKAGELVEVNLRPKTKIIITWLYDINIDTDDIDSVNKTVVNIEIFLQPGIVEVDGFFDKTDPQILQWIKTNVRLTQ